MGKRKKSSSDSDGEESSDDKKKKKKKKAKESESSSDEENESSGDSESEASSSSSDAKKKNKKGGKKNKKSAKKKGKDKKAKKSKGKNKKGKKGKDKAKGKKSKKDKKASKGKDEDASANDGSDEDVDKNIEGKRKNAKDSGSEAGESDEGGKGKKKKKSKDAKKDSGENENDEADENEDEESSDPEFEPQFTIHKGISPGGDVFSSRTTVEKAKRKCAKIKEVKGFSYQGEDTGDVMLIFFKDFSSKIFPSADWTCFKLIDEKEQAQQAAGQSGTAAQAQDDDGDKEDEDADATENRAAGEDELERQAREREVRAQEAENREKELKAKWEEEQRQALIEKWEKERNEAREKAEKEETDESLKGELKSEDESSKGDDDETGPALAAAPEETKPSKEELERVEMERRKEELAEFQGSTAKNDGGMILSMWKEDVLINGHHSVWGSWYDADWGEWGYACCQQKTKDAKCTGKKLADKAETSTGKFVNQDDIKELTSDSGESSGEDHVDGENRVVDFSNSPTQLKPRAEFGGSSAGYIEHFLRYWIGVWRKESEANPKFDGYSDIEKAAFGGALPEVEKAVTPLIWRLKSGKTLERGEGKWKTRCRETRTGMDGKLVKEQSVMLSLDQMASFASEREYAKSNTTYTRLTFGNKMWNLTHVSHVAACTMKGAREYRRNRDSLNTYDMDPVSQRYMHAMKKIVQFAQVKNPSDDMSKNVVM